MSQTTEVMTETVSPVRRHGLAALLRWVRVCDIDDLTVERGCAALVRGEQVALVRTITGDVFAVAHTDPFSGANVIARGIVGTRGGVPTITSPMYKQVFDLRNGRCLDTAGYQPKSGTGDLAVWDVLISDGDVLVTNTPITPPEPAFG